VGSGIHGDAKAELASFAATTGGRLAAEWAPCVTHVVCGVDANGRAKRTAKYLLGLAAGARVVAADWMPACLAAGVPLPEERCDRALLLPPLSLARRGQPTCRAAPFAPAASPAARHLAPPHAHTHAYRFLVAGDIAGGEGGAARALAARAAGAPPLLAGLSFVLAGAFKSPASVAALLAAGGGRVLARLPPPGSADASGLRVLIDVDALAEAGRAVASVVPAGAAALRAPVLPLRWLMDSVSAHRLSECAPLA